ncbi:MAG: 3-hydroxyacyl-ACP dehydratase FabZ [Rickettsiaceae bacterium]|nr:3-hydroxyacyl-ACP dehydratase FabZ [Rickettsiaceae bacterium]
MSEQAIIDINEIMSLIPHRYPFLLVDRVIEINLNQSIVGIKNVTMNEPQFTGHFPERPIMPGVLIIEALAQLSAVLVAKSSNSLENKEVFFMSIDDCKFRKVVEPGDTLYMYASIMQNRGDVWKLKTYAKVADNLVSEAVVKAMLKNKT